MLKAQKDAQVIQILPIHWLWRNGRLNTRAYHALAGAGIRHLGELKTWTRNDLWRLKNVYAATILHIETVLRAHDLALKPPGSRAPHRVPG